MGYLLLQSTGKTNTETIQTINKQSKLSSLFSLLLPFLLNGNRNRNRKKRRASIPLFLSSFIRADNIRIGPIGSLTKENGGGEQTQLGKRENENVRKKFSLRLRPRLRLLTMRMKRVPVRSMLNDFGKFLRKNVKKLILLTAITVALGFCCLFLKLTAMTSSKVVPYSDLITSLQRGNVTKALLEEGSHLINYNTDSQSLEISRREEEKPQKVNVSVENVANTCGREQDAKTSM
ncbi:uncharacterized protein LOC119996841 [Tripterygium wilfordii]|uniref:uncharacterized protein LOC119996841 n=1 Tax=Tripterygium wilfordii TaxID=458696 RepID=UPI0018F809A5|nr:uncharacterized protein LOC119996841 [Tripterygium wilfordii]